MFKSGPNYAKLKTNLRLSINRLRLLEKKKTELAQKARKEIADYIANGKEDRARIRVEHIVREDYLVEAMEMLEMYCDLLLARFGLISVQKELDAGLEEPIASLIWSSPRLQADVIELKAVADQFTLKYGKEFAMACKSNSLCNVNEKLMHKLGVEAPPRILVERYMLEIARTYNVPFEPDPTVMSSEDALTAEDMLINFDVDKKPGNSSGGASGGGGGGLPSMEPVKTGPINPNAAAPFAYPAQQPPSAPYSSPPQLPSMPPAGPAPPPYNNGPAPPVGFNIPPAPGYNELYDNQVNSAAAGLAHPKPPNVLDTLPDLPAVPSNSLPQVGGASAGGEDVDFDDLTRRFEDLKKKK